MAKIHLNKKALEQAERLIKAGEIESFDSNWESQKPTADEINNYLDSHYTDEYGMWFLGTDQDMPKDIKEHYVYPYGDLKTVQRAALEDTIKKAQKAGHADIAQVAKRFLELVDQRKD